ncbi:hypothetical protein IEQ34_000312 [Dendrobium chrysotoxum]|uniref:MADS-box domain-containing protein n=1 Tax=Dendrobium chrysotoxum TaxID=161865 RepID=A0AAV7HQV4_DENCH|nr:hypothetical protein IEQ34_000312 [Dendrobium chrysotoxum]
MTGGKRYWQQGASSSRGSFDPCFIDTVDQTAFQCYLDVGITQSNIVNPRIITYPSVANHFLRNINAPYHNNACSSLVKDAKIIQYVLRSSIISKDGDRIHISPLLSMTTYYIMAHRDFNATDLIFHYIEHLTSIRDPGHRRRPNLALGHLIAYALETKHNLQYLVPSNIQPSFYSSNSFHALHSTRLHSEPSTDVEGEGEEAAPEPAVPAPLHIESSLDHLVHRGFLLLPILFFVSHALLLLCSVSDSILDLCSVAAGCPMGRTKLSIKYRDNCRASRATYLTRLKGLKKKAGELSLLCGVDVLVASFSSELNALEFWPENNTPEFCRIRERCLKESGHYEENGKITEQQIPCQPMPSPSFPLPTFLEEKAAIKIKLIEVWERIDFLQHQSTEEVERFQAQLAIFIHSQQPQYIHPHHRPSPFSHSISPQLPV